MIRSGLDISSAGEIMRIDARNALRISLQTNASDTTDAVVEVRRGYGANGPTVPYTPAVTIPLDGDTIVDLDIDDAPEVVLVVTTPGSAGDLLDVGYELQGFTEYWEHFEQIDLSVSGVAWSMIRGSSERHMAMVIMPALANTAEIRLVESASWDIGAGVPRSDIQIAADESVTAFYTSAAERIGIEVTTPQADQIATLYAYSTIGIAGAGMLERDLAMVTDAERWTAPQEFAQGLTLSDGSESAPSLAFANDADCGLYRGSADQWGIVVGGAEILTMQDTGSGAQLIGDGQTFEFSALSTFTVKAPELRIENSSSSFPGILRMGEASNNGSNTVQFIAPTIMSSDVTIIWPQTQPVEGDGIRMDAGFQLSASPWVNAMAIAWEESSDLSTSTLGGFQWSLGNGYAGVAIGFVAPFDGEVIGASLSINDTAPSDIEVEVYKVSAGSPSSAMGISATVTAGDRTGTTNATASGAAFSAGEWLIPKTIAASGSVAGRFIMFIRPTE